MSVQSATTVTRAQIDQAFKSLGQLEGMAGKSDTEWGDQIAQILHYAASTLTRKDIAAINRRNRQASERAYREAMARRHEEEQLGMALMDERIDDLLWSEIGLGAD
ncbi:hypothetical protein BH11ARM1_BH11ARM1_12740 [soil metagenome]